MHGRSLVEQHLPQRTLRTFYAQGHAAVCPVSLACSVATYSGYDVVERQGTQCDCARLHGQLGLATSQASTGWSLGVLVVAARASQGIFLFRTPPSAGARQCSPRACTPSACTPSRSLFQAAARDAKLSWNNCVAELSLRMVHMALLCCIYGDFPGLCNWQSGPLSWSKRLKIIRTTLLCSITLTSGEAKNLAL